MLADLESFVGQLIHAFRPGLTNGWLENIKHGRSKCLADTLCATSTAHLQNFSVTALLQWLTMALHASIKEENGTRISWSIGAVFIVSLLKPQPVEDIHRNRNRRYRLSAFGSPSSCFIAIVRNIASLVDLSTSHLSMIL